MVWGGRSLATKLGKSLPDDQPYGESWEVSDHPLHRSVVSEGSLAGTTLRQLMETRRDELLGPNSTQTTFPILVKFLDCSDWLSVQVHPDEEAVKRLWPGEGSKTEAWFVLDTEPGSRIYAGLKPGVGEREVRVALQAGTVADCLHSFEPKPGDCVFLPAGTVHAVGGGVLMAEVQQTSDATFRLFDWNRRDAQGNARKLHIEESLASIHWNQGPVEPRTGSCDLVRCKYFELNQLHITDSLPLTSSHKLPAIVLVLDGEGTLEFDGHSSSVHPGQTWLVAAECPRVSIQPHSQITILSCTF
jgi:mannose-6-phosphate isomerase